MGEYQSGSKQGTDMIEQIVSTSILNICSQNHGVPKSCTYLLSLPPAQNPFYMKETRYCSN